MRRVIGLTAGLVLLVIGLAFAIINADPVNVDLFFVEYSFPLSFVLVVTLALGAVLGGLASLGARLRRRSEVARLRRQIDDAERELKSLRRLPLRDGH